MKQTTGKAHVTLLLTVSTLRCYDSAVIVLTVKEGTCAGNNFKYVTLAALNSMTSCFNSSYALKIHRRFQNPSRLELFLVFYSPMRIPVQAVAIWSVCL